MRMTSSTIVTPHDHHTTPLHHHGRNLNLHNVVDMPKNIKPLVCITPLMLMCGDFPGKWVVLHSSHVKYCTCVPITANSGHVMLIYGSLLNVFYIH